MDGEIITLSVSPAARGDKPNRCFKASSSGTALVLVTVRARISANVITTRLITNAVITPTNAWIKSVKLAISVDNLSLGAAVQATTNDNGWWSQCQCNGRKRYADFVFGVVLC
jgi:hypothetical protein